MFRVLSLILLLIIFRRTAAATYSVKAYYSDEACDIRNAYQVHAAAVSNCTAETCSSDDVFGSSSSSADRSLLLIESNVQSVECSTDYKTSMINILNGTSYAMIARFEDDDCSNFDYAYGTTELGTCVENKYQGGYSNITLNADGSVSIRYFADPDCLSDYASVTANSSAVLNHECSSHNYAWYTSNDPVLASASSGAVSTSGTGSSNMDGHNYNRGNNEPTPADSSDHRVSAVVIVSAVFSCVVVALVAVIIILYRRLKSQTPGENRSGLWDDDIITATRIPRNKISIKRLLCRGAFGEVYSGVFNRQQVAVKMLLPATRTDLRHVNAFLTEAKMTATMDHPHIVYFVGVAWDSLSDLCLVLEYMDGGDLRTLLNTYEAEQRPVGVNRQKAIIALQVCHALTYLHSLSPPVIHRDLKSRNILLDRYMTAKLTDFGISRDRLDRTMTAGVGTSLWMAPEVMLGERYGVKADIFSFGVVLSELDVHTMPYAQVKQQCRETEGRELGDATLLQRVSTGQACVEFSYMSSGSIVELGNACISVDPANRPTAAEALYRLQVILARELALDSL